MNNSVTVYQIVQKYSRKQKAFVSKCIYKCIELRDPAFGGINVNSVFILLRALLS